MNDLDAALREVWERLYSKLKRDPDELARRLARWRAPTLLRPRRAWCLAVRASDTRINPATARISPSTPPTCACTSRSTWPHRSSATSTALRSTPHCCALPSGGNFCGAGHGVIDDFELKS